MGAFTPQTLAGATGSPEPAVRPSPAPEGVTEDGRRPCAQESNRAGPGLRDDKGSAEPPREDGKKGRGAV